MADIEEKDMKFVLRLSGVILLKYETQLKRIYKYDTGKEQSLKKGYFKVRFYYFLISKYCIISPVAGETIEE